MTNEPMNRMIQVAIYQLKKQYGAGPVDIYQHTTNSVDITTGEKTEDPSFLRIQKAVILPAKVERNIVSTISKISADKPFVYGGSYDRTRRMFLIDQKDAPELNLTPDDWLIYRGRKYDIASFEAFEYDSLWVIIAHELLGERAKQVHQVYVHDAMPLSNESSTN